MTLLELLHTCSFEELVTISTLLEKLRDKGIDV